MWRRLGTGAVIKYLLLSLREWQRLLGLDKQKETGIWQAPCLPLLSPQRNFLGGQKCAYHSCMPGALTLPGLRYARTNALPILPCQASPLIQRASGATPPRPWVFYSRWQPLGSIKGREQESCLGTLVSLLEHEWGQDFYPRGL